MFLEIQENHVTLHLNNKYVIYDERNLIPLVLVLLVHKNLSDNMRENSGKQKWKSLGKNVSRSGKSHRSLFCVREN